MLSFYCAGAMYSAPIIRLFMLCGLFSWFVGDGICRFDNCGEDGAYAMRV